MVSLSICISPYSKKNAWLAVMLCVKNFSFQQQLCLSYFKVQGDLSQTTDLTSFKL